MITFILIAVFVTLAALAPYLGADSRPFFDERADSESRWGHGITGRHARV